MSAVGLQAPSAVGAREGSLRARGGIALGTLVGTLIPPLGRALLRAWPQDGPRGRLARLLYRAVLKRVMAEYYHPETPSSRREALKGFCMSAEQGVAWATQYAQRGFPDRDTGDLAMFRMLEERMAEGRVQRLHQVACSSGREIAYFARRYPMVTCVGSDMDDAIVADCRRRWSGLPNLSFVVVRLDRLDLEEQDRLRSDLVYSSGGLQYLDAPTLRRFFQVTAALAKELMLLQPLAIAAAADGQGGSTPRGNFSWNHPYVTYLRQTGWTDRDCAIGLVDEDAEVKVVSVDAVSGAAGVPP